MKLPRSRFTVKNRLGIVALFIASFLSGCDDPSTPSCAATVEKPGSYLVTFVNTDGILESFSTHIHRSPTFGIRDCSYLLEVRELMARVDLSLLVTDLPDPVNVGSDLTYTITVTNSNSFTVTDIRLLDQLPSSVDFISASPGCGQPSADNIVTCNLAPLTAGASATVIVVVRPTETGTITNGVDLIAAGVLNTAVTETTVDSAPDLVPDLSVVKISIPDSVTRGNPVTYTVTVTNNGPGLATGVVLIDSLPPLEIDSSTIVVSQGSFTRTNRPFAITCNFGTLASGASATLTFAGFTGPAGTITNTATVTANEADPNTSNNTATVNTTVNPP